MRATPPAGFGDPTCAHREREDGVCTRCGHCEHELILNRACYFCGTTELDPVALSPKKPAPVIPAQALVRKKS
ncbi:MAG: hypothetical protein KF773_06520 [Deltaproteobacteria bacterium]|nr:hypothetical protein [Deltaproteobacteria bacterium]MCW5807456.1 hypothetical protein [Deltaproteobacteria bacterium]